EAVAESEFSIPLGNSPMGLHDFSYSVLIPVGLSISGEFSLYYDIRAPHETSLTPLPHTSDIEKSPILPYVAQLGAQWRSKM
ncbi:hypothetical protein J6590_032377, partial [Homalodisca vitripennis]